jgi:hypothetical protein
MVQQHDFFKVYSVKYSLKMLYKKILVRVETVNLSPKPIVTYSQSRDTIFFRLKQSYSEIMYYMNPIQSL